MIQNEQIAVEKNEVQKVPSEELLAEAKRMERLLEFGYGGTDRGPIADLRRKRYYISGSKLSEVISLTEAAVNLWNDEYHTLYRVIECLKKHNPEANMIDLEDIMKSPERLGRLEKYLPPLEDNNAGVFISAVCAELYSLRDVQDTQLICEF